MAICTGCKVDSRTLSEYDEDNPVTEDGTYFDGKFVCTACYCDLIRFKQPRERADIGSPLVIQQRAKFMAHLKEAE